MPLTQPVIRWRTSMSVPEEYDAFAADYHWLYSDHVLSGKPFVEEHAGILKSAAPDARILDCACGIGVHVLALARGNRHVTGSDASVGMVAEAQRRAAAEGLDVDLTASLWAALPEKWRGEFDLVFCCGNAIGHCRDADEAVASLRGIRSVMKPDATLVLDSRNWGKLRRDRPRFHPMATRTRDGRQCLPLYVWNFPHRWRDPHVVELVLLFQKEGGVYHHCYPITYYRSLPETPSALKTLGLQNRCRFGQNRP